MGNSWFIRRSSKLLHQGRSRQKELLLKFDFLCLMLALVITGSIFLCAEQHPQLTGNNSAGFAYWFLLFIGYLPFRFLLAFDALIKSVTLVHLELLSGVEPAVIYGGFDLILLAVVWALIRFWAMFRFGEKTVRVTSHLLLILLVWGAFQLFCSGAALLWDNDHRTVLSCPAVR